MRRSWGLVTPSVPSCTSKTFVSRNSRFGEQVQDYADLYTSRVSNFLYYSPMQVFRSPRAIMPHERVTVRRG